MLSVGFEPTAYSSMMELCLSITPIQHMVGRIGFEPIMYLTSQVYSLLASPICISTHIGKRGRIRTYRGLNVDGFGDRCLQPLGYSLVVQLI